MVMKNTGLVDFKISWKLGIEPAFQFFGYHDFIRPFSYNTSNKCLLQRSGVREPLKRWTLGYKIAKILTT